MLAEETRRFHPPLPFAESCRGSGGAWAILVHGPDPSAFTDTPEDAEIGVSLAHGVEQRDAIVRLLDKPPFRSRTTGEWAGWASFVAWAE